MLTYTRTTKSVSRFSVISNATDSPVKKIHPIVAPPGFDRFMQHTLAPIDEPNNPDNYSVILWNDETTPFNVVVTTLEQVFGIRYPAAFDLMMFAHSAGKAVILILPETEARKKLAETIPYCSGYSLRFSIEKE